MRRLLALGALLLALATAAWAHAYHASIMEARLNAKTQQLEVALKVFSDDLETALSAGQPRHLSLSEMAPAQLTPLLATYVRRTVAIGTRPGEALPITYIGQQTEKDAQWLYFSVKLPAAARGLNLRHRLLLEQFPDQMNVVNLEAAGKKQSALFREGNEEQRLSW
ncbi:hypothetical protein LJ737_08525 [Hymenobacter sp. 15J16-1T3B]|uniref:DUF6702 family protein n=1 Tax=Hymenobacter sp. 15J16-1T3B TaxID=2886941 RepID=UPI001D10C97E|nr:DUF6702 family protein [Hymenobacter sp. 15J16-1T3B]MCC3157281.1 hypothetical protein [Hymenobacter sp. 15J16-1T3B]